LFIINAVRFCFEHENNTAGIIIIQGGQKPRIHARATIWQLFNTHKNCFHKTVRYSFIRLDRHK